MNMAGLNHLLCMVFIKPRRPPKLGKKREAFSTKRTNHGLPSEYQKLPHLSNLGAKFNTWSVTPPSPMMVKKKVKIHKGPSTMWGFSGYAWILINCYSFGVGWVAKMGFWTSLFGANIYCSKHLKLPPLARRHPPNHLGCLGYMFET